MRSALLFLLTTVALTAQDRTIVPLGSGGKRVALAIGNDAYTSLDKLFNARNDAHSVASALTVAGFQVTTVTDAKLEDMDRAVNTFIRSIQPRDVALFYYSGHAAEIDGQNLLIPVDLSADMDEIQVRNRALRASEVLERMEARGAALQLIVLDACRTNPFRSMRGGGSGGLASMAAGRGTFIAYASAPGKPASDNRRAGNGLFTSYLIEAMRTPGLELQQVFAQAGEGTETGSGGKQVPWISHSVRGQFYFLASNVRPPDPVVVVDRGPRAGQVKVNQKDGQRYVWIPPGKFTMGCSQGDTECFGNESPAHEVEITRGFWLGQTVATVGAWKRYRTATGKPALPTTDTVGRKDLNDAGGDDNLPSVFVTWDEAKGFCEYSGGRLPTEAEWEYAARAGNQSARYGSLDSIAWYADNSGRTKIDSAGIWRGDEANYGKRLFDNGNGPRPVGQKGRNDWNLYDMLGNVWQWTADWYDEKYYAQRDGRDPLGPPGGKQRPLRGGAWDSPPTYVRVSYRFNAVGPERRSTVIGVRCAGN